MKVLILGDPTVMAAPHLDGAARRAARIGACGATEGTKAFFAGGRPHFLSDPQSILQGANQ
jgi:hypothetical protein